MSRWPYDTGSSFVRYPSFYVHDAFGHVGDDDRGIRTPCFRKIPHTGTDVSSKTPSTNKAAQRQTPVASPVDGEIVAQGFDVEAGSYQIIKHARYSEWWIGGHHSALLRKGGQVQRGDLIARMGDTGGAKGVHTHWSVATSYAAAVKYITGYVSYRDGRSVSAWAVTMGLVDPWPLIEREWADEERRLEREAAAKAAAQAATEKAAAEALADRRREDDMPIYIEDEAGNVYSAGQQFLRHETHRPAGVRAAKLLTAAGEIVKLSDNDFRETLNALGVPLAAADATRDGKLWSPATGLVDARTLKV